jgi:flagellar M-ring protein FliF
MVAASIEGLAPNDVTITDLNGHMLSNNSNGNQAYFEQLEYQNRIEAEKVAKAESLLQTYLGEGKAVVKVTAEVDFTKRTRSQKTYDPNSKVKDRETISSTESKGAKENPVGAAGTSSNLALTGQGSADSQSSEKTETIEASYRNGEANEKTEEQAGGIKRLTVSAIVDLSGQQSGGQGGQLTLTDVEDLIKSAVGFKAERTDLIKVISGTIPDADDGGEEIIAGVNQWEFVTTMVRNSSLGLAAVVALIALQLALRKMKPVTIVVDRDIDTKRERALSRLSTQIQENPEAVSKILSTWLRDSDSSGVESAKAA